MGGFRGDQLAFVRFWEEDNDGAAEVGGNVFTTCCDIRSFNWEVDQEDAETVTVGNANRSCRASYRRPAIKNGLIVSVGTVGRVPELDNLLLGSPVNENVGNDVIGARDQAYTCKYVGIDLAVTAVSGACATGAQGRLWRAFFKVGQWNITQDETYDDNNEIPTVIYEGYAEVNPEFDDPFGIWDASPDSYWDEEAFTSYAILSTSLPECDDTFTTVPS